MNLLFSDTFIENLKKFSSIKVAVKNKVAMIAENPTSLGEPLKANLRGFYSYPVRKNFIIIYLYCDIIITPKNWTKNEVSYHYSQGV